MDFNAELKTLQTSVKELQAENQGMNLLVVATFIKILTALLIKFPSVLLVGFCSTFLILFCFSVFLGLKEHLEAAERELRLVRGEFQD